MKLEIFQAIKALYPQVVISKGEITYDSDENEVAYDKDAVQAKMGELQQAKEQEQQASEANKASALAKLSALGLTADEIKAITGA
jgi:hypothetical protein